MEEKNIKILAIESSCDETAAAVVENGRKVLSNVISTQIDIHTLYGGVVPEIASRKHLERINQVVKEALKQASVTLDDIDAVAVTYGPGLVGALLVGTAEAKAIAYAAGKPLVGVHHIEGHIAANYIENQDLEPPFMCLIVSGGHTHLVVVEDYDKLIALFVGIAYWNDWMNGYIYITKNTDLYSVQNLLNRMMQNIQYLSQNSSNIQQAGVGLNAIPTASVRMAMATVGVLPILVVYPFVQKYFVKGITLGGVKG